MAGIGFELKKLASHDNLMGVVAAYASAGLAAAGPWLFTIFAIAGITILYASNLAYEDLIIFRVILVYNLAASLVLSSPVFMVITRYIADAISAKDVTNVPSTLLGCLVLLFFIQIIPALFFYGYYFELSLALRICAIANLFLLTGVWLLGVYLMALKDFHAVNWSYAIGMLVAVLAAHYLRDDYGSVGMLNGFSLGISVIVFSLVAKVFAEYPYKFHKPFDMMPSFSHYYQLALGGFFYNLAIWCDKLLMWFAPEAIDNISGTKMIMYPDYDSAMFLAYVTIVPSMAVFVFSVETNFFQHYRRYYDDILGHKPFRTIQENGQKMIDSVLHHARTFMVVQGAISFLAIVLAAQILDALNINYRQIGIFRLGVLGGMLHVLAMFMMIILSYFDSRNRVMWLQFFFLITNVVFTIITMYMGFPFYGYGYFMSSACTFLLTAFVLFNFMNKLPYHAFITHNNTIRVTR
jgi:polysaccharide biosynthesis protein PelG